MLTLQALLFFSKIHSQYFRCFRSFDLIIHRFSKKKEENLQFFRLKSPNRSATKRPKIENCSAKWRGPAFGPMLPPSGFQCPFSLFSMCCHMLSLSLLLLYVKHLTSNEIPWSATIFPAKKKTMSKFLEIPLRILLFHNQMANKWLRFVFVIFVACKNEWNPSGILLQFLSTVRPSKNNFNFILDGPFFSFQMNFQKIKTFFYKNEKSEEDFIHLLSAVDRVTLL